MKKFTAYRRSDYVFPRSMREAFGDDELEPELRCCSELFGRKTKRTRFADVALYVVIAAVIVWQMIANYGN